MQEEKDILEELLGDLCARLEADVPALAWADMEAGQMDNQEGEYPFPFPACWVDVQGIEWGDAGRSVEHGTATVNFRVALDIYDDTHTGSPARHTALAKFRILSALHRAVKKFSGENYNNLMRVRTTTERRTDGYKVFNVVYKCDVVDRSAMERSKAVRVSLEVRPN